MGEYLQRLKELRLDRGLSQKDIADYLGITVAAYSLYERGAREPNITTLKKLAAYFNVSLDYLLENDETNEINDRTTKYVSLFSSCGGLKAAFDTSDLTDDEMKDVSQYIEFLKNRRKL